VLETVWSALFSTVSHMFEPRLCLDRASKAPLPTIFLLKGWMETSKEVPLSTYTKMLNTDALSSEYGAQE